MALQFRPLVRPIGSLATAARLYRELAPLPPYRRFHLRQMQYLMRDQAQYRRLGRFPLMEQCQHFGLLALILSVMRLWIMALTIDLWVL